MRHHDLLVIGAGSGNSVVDDSFAGLDVAIVEESRFGGTCLNVGCIPTKMLVRAADLADDVADSGRLDVDAELRGVRWRDLRDRVFGRLDPVARDGKAGREDTPWITVYDAHARFTGPRTLDIGGIEVSADRIVVAAGSRPLIPPPVTDSGLPYETSDTVMRVDDPPRRLAVLGGGYIAAELAHVFSSAGTAITIIDMADTLLAGQDVLVAREFTELVSKEWDVRLGREVAGVSGSPGALVLALDDDTTVEADMLLVAVGRVPNGDGLELDVAGIDVHDDGRIVVDEYQRTTTDGVWALGDVSTPVPLKHVANREADVVRHNLRHPDDLHTTGDAPVPSAIFTSPQIAAVGATEQELSEAGTAFGVGLTRFSDVAYGWALEDTTGFAKVLVDPGTSRLLGAHVLGPQASTLIQPLVLAMTLDLDARTLAERPYWIHPALTEVVQQALQDAL
ncbi:MAG: mycothione reductase [Pseudonocardiaceae bacterium]|nr:MAG: mycothione reductase [Pseudonocardiaceae bacterium]